VKPGWLERPGWATIFDDEDVALLVNVRSEAALVAVDSL
jgi:hypothetical protein